MTSIYHQNKSLSEPVDSPIVDEQKVADFLKSNPDFFRKNPGVLVNMELPHASGNAVSLVERQVAVLRERSIETRHKLGELVSNAKDNDALLEKTQTLILALLRSETLDELFKIVTHRFTLDFDVNHCCIFLLSDTLDEGSTPSALPYIRSSHDARQSIGSLLETTGINCGALRETEADFLFNNQQVQSAAIALRNIKTALDKEPCQLLIAVGHSDSNHYNRDTGTLFLNYIADILQVLVNQHIDTGH